MRKLTFGPGLSGFPAFPELSLTPQTVSFAIQALGFRFTNETFTFALDSGALSQLGVVSPFPFRYEFRFEGDFSQAAALPPEALPLLFSAASPLITIQNTRTINVTNGANEIAIALDADSPSVPLPFATFFGTLLDPNNFTTDILRVLFGPDLTGFDTIDVSAFTNGVIMGRPNTATISVDGVVDAPIGDTDSTFGVVSFDGEIRELIISHLIAGKGNDILGANSSGLIVDAGAGNDTVAGGAGADVLRGEQGNDVLLGGGGADSVFGGAGNDVLVVSGAGSVAHGGGGSDVLVADASATLTGGAGADLFVVRRAPGAEVRITDLSFFEGDRLDINDLTGGQNPAQIRRSISHEDGDTVFATADGQRVVLENVSLNAGQLTALFAPSRHAGPTLGSSGNDVLSVAKGMVFGGAGNDVVRVRGADETLVAGEAGNDQLFGGRGNDTLLGGADNDLLLGARGSDILFGGTGTDTLNGGEGDDVLDGGEGNDVLIGGPGVDILTGGPGADIFVFKSFDGSIDRVTDFEIGIDKIDLSEILRDLNVNETNLDNFVIQIPLGPTELTGFLAIDVTGQGNTATAVVVGQFDGATFALGPTGSFGQLSFGDLIV